MMEPYRTGLKPLAQQLRSHQTDAEAALWHRLRRQQLGVIFNRQKPIGNYIVDFYSAAAKLVIELDGSQHLTQGQHDDLRRDLYLMSLGLTVLRFDNLQVLNEIEGVMTVILQTIQKQIPPNPPSAKGGATAANQLSSAPFSATAITEKITDPSDKAELIPPFEKGGLGGISTLTKDNSNE